MKNVRTYGWAVVASILLAACGGGDPYVPGAGAPSGAPTTRGAFSAVISFGDSLSDLGTYTPATVVPNTGGTLFFGGKFTTNVYAGAVNTSAIWIENVAARLGLAITPAEMGFAGQSVKCPFVVACTAYGQGGARVTDLNGVRHGSGALTVPIKTQIANHLLKAGSFTANDLVLIQAGGNDLFMVMDPTQVDSFPAKVAALQQQIGAAVAAGQLTQQQADTAFKQGLFLLQSEAQATMQQAALELATYIRNDILGKGAKYVVVMNLPDLGATPEGLDYAELYQRPDITGLLSTLSDTFNLWLREGMVGQPVLWMDAEALFRDAVANPGAYQMTDSRHRACDVQKMAQITGGLIADGFSLFCNATTGSPVNGVAASADINTWFFADGNHPTVGGHKVLSDAVVKQLQAAGWI